RGASANSTARATSAIRAARLWRRPAVTRTNCWFRSWTWKKFRKYVRYGSSSVIAGRKRMARSCAWKRPARQQRTKFRKQRGFHHGNDDAWRGNVQELHQWSVGGIPLREDV